MSGAVLMPFQVRNWGRFQHYRKRRPPWIKLYRDILDDYEYLTMSLASMALAPCIWLLASESEDGTVTDDLEKLSFRLHRPKQEIIAAIEELVAKNFLTRSGDDASTVLAFSKQHATLERETETEAEEETTPSKPRKATNYPVDFAAFWDAYPKKVEKQDALAAWKKTKLERPPLDVLLASLEKQKRSLQWTRDEGQYIPHPHRWLKKERWNDQVEVAGDLLASEYAAKGNSPVWPDYVADVKAGRATPGSWAQWIEARQR